MDVEPVHVFALSLFWTSVGACIVMALGGIVIGLTFAGATTWAGYTIAFSNSALPTIMKTLNTSVLLNPGPILALTLTLPTASPTPTPNPPQTHALFNPPLPSSAPRSFEPHPTVTAQQGSLLFKLVLARWTISAIVVYAVTCIREFDSWNTQPKVGASMDSQALAWHGMAWHS